jgi:hypothetical protein
MKPWRVFKVVEMVGGNGSITRVKWSVMNEEFHGYEDDTSCHDEKQFLFTIFFYNIEGK